MFKPLIDGGQHRHTHKLSTVNYPSCASLKSDQLCLYEPLGIHSPGYMTTGWLQIPPTGEVFFHLNLNLN